MNGGVIGEAIYIGVSDGKWDLIAAECGGVPTRGWVRRVSCFPCVLRSDVRRL